MSALTALAFLLLIVLFAWISYVVISGFFIWPPPIPTSPKTRRRMIGAIKTHRPTDATRGLIVDPGCGFGGLTLALARAFPEASVVGVDLQPFPILIARCRARLLGLHNATFRRGDLFEEDYSAAQVVACYLYGDVMERLYSKWDRELQAGCVIVTNLHPIPNWQPVQEIPVKDWLFVSRAIYAYRIPESKTLSMQVI